MYKLLLCWRYLRTRFLAIICIVSVMLGVATLIVVNSVMSGFSNKLKDRLHGILSDVVIESPSYSGFPIQPDRLMEYIRESPVGEHIEAMTPTVELFAILQFPMPNGELATRPVRLIGVDPEGRAALGGFAEHLTLPENRERPSFEIPKDIQERLRLRREMQRQHEQAQMALEPLEPGAIPPPDPPPSSEPKDQGIIIGYAIASFRQSDAASGDAEKDIFVLNPGDDVLITTVGAQELSPVYSRFIVVDYFKSEMSEYDSNYVFVPLEYLQRIRAMEGRVTSIQMRLTDYRHADLVIRELQKLFPGSQFIISTWEDKQGPLLAAIDIERGILNVLLFLIVGVAGFSILAIFSMIVFEKTRDIGILKSLGASNRGVMMIFLGYGLLLAVVGCVLGTILGLVFTDYINEIEQFLASITGQDIFDRRVYYFDEIPTNIDALTVVLVNLGAIAIAVTFSILPAFRAAMLHPVRALRYE